MQNLLCSDICFIVLGQLYKPSYITKLREKIHTDLVFFYISVVYDNFLYAATVSNHRILVSKRKYIPQDPVAA